MADLHDEIERAAEAAVDEIERAFARGSIPVDARGDPEFVREMVLMEMDTDRIGDWESWSEVHGLIDRVIEREM